MFIKTTDNIKLKVEENGEGYPIVFIHEFGGDQRGWLPQINYFSRRYRCITYNARGYPPSDVPDTLDLYSQERAVDDIFDVMNELNIDKAHLVGLSMGGFAVLHFGIKYPNMCGEFKVYLLLEVLNQHQTEYLHYLIPPLVDVILPS